MENFFEKLDELNLTETINHVLKMQVDYPWPKEALCLESHGLSDAKTILDIGTGNGYFLARLAKQYPKKYFTGVEPSKPLVEIANQLIKENRLKNIEIINDRCPTSKLTKSFDFIFSRLAMYAAPNRVEIIKWAYDLLCKKGRMCVIDVDDDWIYTYPKNDNLCYLFNSLRAPIEKDGADRNIGKKLPSMLLAAGFHNIKMEIRTWYSSHELSAENFYDLFNGYATIARKNTPDSFSEAKHEEYKSFLNETVASKVNIAAIPMFVVSGGKITV